MIKQKMMAYIEQKILAIQEENDVGEGYAKEEIKHNEALL